MTTQTTDIEALTQENKELRERLTLSLIENSEPIQQRAVIPGLVASSIASDFQVTRNFTGDLVLEPRTEKHLSADGLINHLLEQEKFQGLLYPDGDKDTTTSPTSTSKKETLLDKYNRAKERGDTLTQIGVKRLMAEQGIPAPL